MSDNDFRAPRLKPGSPLKANELNGFTDAARRSPLRRNFGGLTKGGPTGQTFVPHLNLPSSGGALEYATSPNTGYDASFTYGATVPFPGDVAANATALSSDTSFYLCTPWNTRVTAPDNLFAFWNNLEDDYYLPIQMFYLKPTADYPTSGGITTFTCYYNDSATHEIGTNTDFPAGVEVVFNDFTNATASLEVREYFNGQTFLASYDSENNTIYITHPRF